VLLPSLVPEHSLAFLFVTALGKLKKAKPDIKPFQGLKKFILFLLYTLLICFFLLTFFFFFDAEAGTQGFSYMLRMFCYQAILQPLFIPFINASKYSNSLTSFLQLSHSVRKLK
jgi:hypothetical protein